MATHPPGDYNYGVETGQYYTRHRQGGWNELEKISDKYNIICSKVTTRCHTKCYEEVKDRNISIWSV